MAVFLAALHDIGKFTRNFQALCATCWPADVLGPYRAPPVDSRHDTMGFRLLTGPLRNELAAALPGWRAYALDALLRAVTGHHGRPPIEAIQRPPGIGVFCDACRQAAASVLHDLQAVLLPEPPAPPREAEAKRLSWSLAGLVTLADWIGSSQEFFPYEAPLPGGLACSPQARG
jgi:CRISPR-associated endonuclease/helicase Cas3